MSPSRVTSYGHLLHAQVSPGMVTSHGHLLHAQVSPSYPLIPSYHQETPLLFQMAYFYYIACENLKCRYLFNDRLLRKIHRSKKVLFLPLESISGVRRTLVGGWGGWVAKTNYSVCSRTRSREFWYWTVKDMLGGRQGSCPGQVLVLALDNNEDQS